MPSPLSTCHSLRLPNALADTPFLPKHGLQTPLACRRVHRHLAIHRETNSPCCALYWCTSTPAKSRYMGILRVAYADSGAGAAALDAAAVTPTPAAPFSASLAAEPAAAAVRRLLKHNLAAQFECKRRVQRMTRQEGTQTEPSHAPSPPAIEAPKNKDKDEHNDSAAHRDDQPHIPRLLVKIVEETLDIRLACACTHILYVQGACYQARGAQAQAPRGISAASLPRNRYALVWQSSKPRHAPVSGSGACMNSGCPGLQGLPDMLTSGAGGGGAHRAAGQDSSAAARVAVRRLQTRPPRLPRMSASPTQHTYCGHCLRPCMARRKAAQ